MSQRPLPEGTVALLFSDIEGSTRLVQRLGDGWSAVLDRSRTLCREAWLAHGGHELGTEGDSFFVAFGSATQAVAAAVQAQRALAQEPWPEQADVRARIGIHTGEPRRHGEGYVGVDVHLAARVAAAAHGGQVLLTAASAGAVDGRLPDGVAVGRLGTHRLKDIEAPAELCQLVIDGLRTEFPAPRTERVSGSIPTGVARLVGREGELAEVTELLVHAGERQVTLTGPGGSGKTTLAIAVAHAAVPAFRDGVFFVPLASTTDVPGVWAGIAQTLRLDPASGTDAGVLTHLARSRVLLVLDNLEQVGDADLVVRRLWEETAEVSVLATSRRAVGVAREREHVVPPLEPDAAVELFAVQAARVRRAFRLDDANRDDVGAICRALDHLPLAVELAASRAKLLSPAAILKRLDTALDLSGTDRSRPDRQRTLREAIDWSYRLLDGDHQQVLAHLGVFVGGADLAAVEAVVPSGLTERVDVLDTLAALHDLSLVRVAETDDGEPRFELLETIRMFALDMLAARGETERALAAHAQHYHDVAKALADGEGGRPSAQVGSVVERELGNLDAVAARPPATVVDPDAGPLSALTVVSRLQWALMQARHYDLVQRWGRRARQQIGEDEDPEGTLVLLAYECLGLVKVNRFSEAVAMGLRAEALGDRLLPGRPVDLTETAGGLRPAYVMALTAMVWSQLELDNQPGARHAVEAAERASRGMSPFNRLYAVNARLDYHYALGEWEETLRYLTDVARTDPEAVANDPQWFDMRRAEVEIFAGRPGVGARRLATAFAAYPATADAERIIAYVQPLALAFGPSQPLLCARALGALSSHRTRYEQPAQPREQQHVDDYLEPVRALVSDDAWQLAWTDGGQEDVFELMPELLAHELPQD